VKQPRFLQERQTSNLSSNTKSRLVNKILSSDLEEVLVDRKDTDLSGKLIDLKKGHSDMTNEDSNPSKHVSKNNSKQRPFLNNNNSQSQTSSQSGKISSVERQSIQDDYEPVPLEEELLKVAP